SANAAFGGAAWSAASRTAGAGTAACCGAAATVRAARCRPTGTSFRPASPWTTRTTASASTRTPGSTPTRVASRTSAGRTGRTGRTGRRATGGRATCSPGAAAPGTGSAARQMLLQIGEAAAEHAVSEGVDPGLDVARRAVEGGPPLDEAAVAVGHR